MSKFASRLRLPSPYELVAIVLATAALGGVAIAAIPGPSGVFHGCRARTDGIVLNIPHSKGDLRLVQATEPCRDYEARVSWNQEGVPGQDGVDGVSGLERVFATSDDNSVSNKVATVFCPAGKNVVGTGADIVGGKILGQPNGLTDVVIDEITPFDTRVQVDAYEEEPTAEGWYVIAYAICANVSP